MTELNESALLKPFFTPLVAHQWDGVEELNRQLTKAVLAQEQESEGTVRSNIGGWQSKQDFMVWTGEAGRELGRRIIELANHGTRLLLDQFGARPSFSWKISIWANINRRGHWNRMHYHPGSTWSGTYYVDAGEAPPTDLPSAGKISFMDPVLASQMTFFSGLVRQNFEIDPVAGLMVMFPSYLPHFVHPYLGERPRISIAFNIHKEPYP
jgi:uncharacterized protein (TIGR02466 family)